jgi:hypothetical protein
MVTGGEILSVATETGRVCLGLVFLLAAVHKAQGWRLLSGVISSYQLLPRWAVGSAAALLPPLELLLALSLLSAQWHPWPELAVMALLLLFAAAMAINIWRGRTHIDCGCGQEFLAQHLSWALVMRNLFLAVLVLPSIMASESVPTPAALIGIAAGIGFFLLYLLFNLLSALPRARFA